LLENKKILICLW